jgi:biotin carboxylase
MGKKIAIIGASYLQRPLVEKAKEMGIETHVFAWQDGNVVEDIADFYYPISIIEKEIILDNCEKIGIDGIISIASDIAMTTVNFITEKLNLIGNSVESTIISTNKYEMRKALKCAGIPCPKFEVFGTPEFLDNSIFNFPVIVKPTDSSGSKGVTKVNNVADVSLALKKAIDNSSQKKAIVEEYIDNLAEYSVEFISFKAKHYFLAITEKVTTGPPYFVEKEHHQPADVSAVVKSKIIEVVINSLNALGIENGASHSEVCLTTKSEVRVIEIAGRMGGDLIGSDMVFHSTGFDFVKAVIQVALNEFDAKTLNELNNNYAGVYFVFPKAGRIMSINDNSKLFKYVKKTIAILNVGDNIETTIDVSRKRAGVILYCHPTRKLYIKPENVLKFEVE